MYLICQSNIECPHDIMLNPEKKVRYCGPKNYNSFCLIINELLVNFAFHYPHKHACSCNVIIRHDRGIVFESGRMWGAGRQTHLLPPNILTRKKPIHLLPRI